MRLCTLVVPCFNEERRLQADTFLQFLNDCPWCTIVFVDDGSRDNTLTLLRSLRDRRSTQIHVVSMERNSGKAEAVRAGMNYALERKLGDVVGFWDADLATPLETVIDMAMLLEQTPDVSMVFGSRVKLLGRRIDRKPVRHYLGRVFATAVSVVLQMPVYDTQCGAKLFRATPELAAVLNERFCSRWVFDVEILARFIQRAGARTVEQMIYEFPLPQWTDVDGSKVRPKDFVTAFCDVIRIRQRYLTDGGDLQRTTERERKSAAR